MRIFNLKYFSFNNIQVFLVIIDLTSTAMYLSFLKSATQEVPRSFIPELSVNGSIKTNRSDAFQVTILPR